MSRQFQTALLSSMEVALDGGDPEKARKYVRDVISEVGDSTIDDLTTKSAMCRILGKPLQRIPQLGSSSSPIAEAWIAWASNEQSDIHCQRVEAHLSRDDKNQGFLESLAYTYWGEAVIHLLHGDTEGSRGSFIKSSKLCFELHIDIPQSILWTHASTFFPVS